MTESTKDMILEDMFEADPTAFREAFGDVLLQMSDGDLARLSQTVAEADIDWKTSTDHDRTEHVARTPQGDYTITVCTDPGIDETWVVASTPLTGSFGNVRLEAFCLTREEVRREVMRQKAHCVSQYAWLLTHDTSYDAIPETLDF